MTNVSPDKSFPMLPVLSRLQGRVGQLAGLNWDQVSIVAVQHLLESTGSLLQALIALGVPPHRIHILGKHYSSNRQVIDALRAEGINVYPSTDTHPPGQYGSTFRADVSGMWTNVEAIYTKDRPALVIVLDDGGRCIEAIPDRLTQSCRVVGIEQTTSGVRITNNRMDVIQVATSAAKKLLEPPLIANAVFDKVTAYLPSSERAARCGVIGLGNIGKSIALGLIAMGHEVFGADKDSALHGGVPGVIWCKDANAVLSNAEYIFGCTGEDVFSGEPSTGIGPGTKTLLSVSSEDVEFNSLLRTIGQRDDFSPRQDVSITLPSAVLRIVKGGFPVNFDGTRTSVASEAIQLTRGLLLGGVVQAALLHKHGERIGATSNLMLDPVLQQFVVSMWYSVYRDAVPLPEGLTEKFLDAAWIAANSQGRQIQLESLREALV